MSVVDLNLYSKGMNQLNQGFNNVGNIIKNNAKFINLDVGPEAKEKGIEMICTQIANNQFLFENARDEFKIIEDSLRDNINETEIEPFIKHILELFPTYIPDLGNSISGLKNIGLNSPQYDLTINNLEEVIEDIIAIFNNILDLAKTFKIEK